MRQPTTVSAAPADSVMSARVRATPHQSGLDRDSGEPPLPSLQGPVEHPTLVLLGGTDIVDRPVEVDGPAGFQAWSAVSPMPRCAAAWYA